MAGRTARHSQLRNPDRISERPEQLRTPSWRRPTCPLPYRNRPSSPEQPAWQQRPEQQQPEQQQAQRRPERQQQERQASQPERQRQA